MKKLYNTLLISSISFTALAQGATSDTIYMLPAYAKQVYYNLETGAKTAIDQDSWDIAFNTRDSRNVSIISNYGTEVYLYPNGDTGAYNGTIDTSGIATWDAVYNDVEDWDNGSFNVRSTNGSFDYGWGIYDMTSHYVNGHVFYIIKTKGGNYKKIWFKEMNNLGEYTIIYADLDGSNSQTLNFKRSDYSSYLMAHYSIDNNAFITTIPTYNNWQFVCTQYYTPINNGTNVVQYGVTGILTNDDLKIAKLINVDVNADIPNYSDETAHNFTVVPNTIGYQWKSYNGNNYTIEDSTAYILRDQTDTYWKIVMTAFEGGATGKLSFNKLKLGKGVSINTVNHDIKLQLFPNPATGDNIHLSAECTQSKNAAISIVDMTGKVIYQQVYRFQEGMNALALPIQQLSQGMYFINIDIDGIMTHQKFVKQ